MIVKNEAVEWKEQWTENEQEMAKGCVLWIPTDSNGIWRMQRWHVLDTAREEPGGQRGNRGVPHILAEYGKVPLLNPKVPFCIIILCRDFQCKIKTRMTFVIKALNKDGCQYCFYQLCLIRGQNLLLSVTSILIKRGHFWPDPPPPPLFRWFLRSRVSTSHLNDSLYWRAYAAGELTYFTPRYTRVLKQSFV